MGNVILILQKKMWLAFELNNFSELELWTLSFHLSRFLYSKLQPLHTHVIHTAQDHKSMMQNWYLTIYTFYSVNDRW